MFTSLRTLSKVNPGLTENLWNYATHNKSITGKQPNAWFNNFVGCVTSANISDVNVYDWGYKVPNKDVICYPIYVGYHPEPIENEPESVASNEPFVVMMYGCDNASYFVRCVDLNQVQCVLDDLRVSEWLHETLENYQTYFYNS